MSADPVALSPSDAVDQALGLFETYPFRHLPVVDLNTLVGIVSDRDLAFAAALPRPRRAPGHGPRGVRRVEEIMHRNVITATPSTTVRVAVESMLTHRVGALPVVKTGAFLVGIVTETDVLRLFQRDACWGESGAPGELLVEAHMSTPVQTVEPGTDLMDAAERLLNSQVRHLPVLEDGKLVGMLSDRDLRRALARLARMDRAIEAKASSAVPRLLVEDAMSRPCMTIERGRSLRAAAYTLLECRIDALPVVDGDTLIGIVSKTDLLQRYRDWSPFAS